MDYVPGNIISVMCPPALCGRREKKFADSPAISVLGSHKRHSDWSQFNKVASVCQGGFRGILSSAVVGREHFSKAACLVRRVISAYRLVVSKLAWPSQARMTFTST